MNIWLELLSHFSWTQFGFRAREKILLTWRTSGQSSITHVVVSPASTTLMRTPRVTCHHLLPFISNDQFVSFNEILTAWDLWLQPWFNFQVASSSTSSAKRGLRTSDTIAPTESDPFTSNSWSIRQLNLKNATLKDTNFAIKYFKDNFSNAQITQSTINPSKWRVFLNESQDTKQSNW